MKPERLGHLHGMARIRKCALLFERIERECLSSAGLPGALERLMGEAREIASFLRDNPESSDEMRAAASVLASFEAGGAAGAGASAGRVAKAGTAPGAGAPLSPDSRIRAIHDFRHLCMRISGQAPADWDMIDPALGREAASGRGESILPHPGLKVYLEDLRSPFNVGTIFRTAEAFGFEEVILSPDCADPLHPRAARSSMGAVSMVPWRRAALSCLPRDGSVFALELGGTPVGRFGFPDRGILILGSEELGVSAQALSLAGERRASIPMAGRKASVNVAVAFGIAAYAWTSSIFR